MSDDSDPDVYRAPMRARDRGLQLIGWGDRQRTGDPSLWADAMLERAGEYLDMIAIHLMGQRPERKDTVLRGNRYQYEPERAWEELLELAKNVETRVRSLEEAVARKKPSAVAPVPAPCARSSRR